jgi:hypothetical protein
MRGSITRVSRKDGSGCILAEDGKEVCFERSEASRDGVDKLTVGNWSNSTCSNRPERVRAIHIRHTGGGT